MQNIYDINDVNGLLDLRHYLKEGMRIWTKWEGIHNFYNQNYSNILVDLRELSSYKYSTLQVQKFLLWRQGGLITVLSYNGNHLGKHYIEWAQGHISI